MADENDLETITTWRLGRGHMKRWFSSMRQSGWLTHSVRTGIATSGSLLAARLSKLPDPYWAAVTTIVVMQSTLGSSLDISKRRMIGTGIGAVTGGLIASCFQTNAGI